MHKKIFDILLRFRIHSVADIEKAFLMVGVSEMNQDALRFLWFRDMEGQEPEVQAYKFTRVVFGVGPSTYLLNATIMHHLELFEDKYSVTVSKLKESMYVDDVVMPFLHALKQGTYLPKEVLT